MKEERLDETNEDCHFLAINLLNLTNIASLNHNTTLLALVIYHLILFLEQDLQEFLSV